MKSTEARQALDQIRECTNDFSDSPTKATATLMLNVIGGHTRKLIVEGASDFLVSRLQRLGEESGTYRGGAPALVTTRIRCTELAVPPPAHVLLWYFHAAELEVRRPKAEGEESLDLLIGTYVLVMSAVAVSDRETGLRELTELVAGLLVITDRRTGLAARIAAGIDRAVEDLFWGALAAPAEEQTDTNVTTSETLAVQALPDDPHAPSEIDSRCGEESNTAEENAPLVVATTPEMRVVPNDPVSGQCIETGRTQLEFDEMRRRVSIAGTNRVADFGNNKKAFELVKYMYDRPSNNNGIIVYAELHYALWNKRDDSEPALDKLRHHVSIANKVMRGIDFELRVWRSIGYELIYSEGLSANPAGDASQSDGAPTSY